jgi:putative transposase
VAGGHLAGHKSAAADLGAWLCFEDESGQGLRPPKGRTWGRRGHTPVVTVTGGHDTRVSLAALIAVRPGQRPRLIWRTHRARRGDKRKGFTEQDYARFLDAAHQQLHGPVVLVWDGLNTHTSRAMRELIAARDWLTVFQLPAYAPELNPVEPVWSNLKRSLANLVKQDIGQLTMLVKTRLRRMQYQPGLLEVRLIVWTTGKAHLGRSLVVFAGSLLKSPRNVMAEGLRLVMTIKLVGGSSGSMPACCMHASG